MIAGTTDQPNRSGLRVSARVSLAGGGGPAAEQLANRGDVIQ
jgi:hypothetical protein